MSKEDSHQHDEAAEEGGIEVSFHTDDTDDHSQAAGDSMVYPPDDGAVRDLDQERRKRRKRLICGSLALLMCILVLVLSLTLPRNKFQVTSEGSEEVDFAEKDLVVTTPPSAAPSTPSPTSSLVFTLAYQVLAPLVSDPSLLVDSNTPQGKAFLTVLNETDPFDIQQRFALMVVWYATGGSSWDLKFGWESYANGNEIDKGDECFWPGVSLCRNQGNGTLAVAGFTLGT